MFILDMNKESRPPSSLTEGVLEIVNELNKQFVSISNIVTENKLFETLIIVHRQIVFIIIRNVSTEPSFSSNKRYLILEMHFDFYMTLTFALQKLTLTVEETLYINALAFVNYSGC